MTADPRADANAAEEPGGLQPIVAAAAIESQEQPARGACVTMPGTSSRPGRRPMWMSLRQPAADRSHRGRLRPARRSPSSISRTQLVAAPHEPRQRWRIRRGSPRCTRRRSSGAAAVDGLQTPGMLPSRQRRTSYRKTRTRPAERAPTGPSATATPAAVRWPSGTGVISMTNLRCPADDPRGGVVEIARRPMLEARRHSLETRPFRRTNGHPLQVGAE